MSAGQRLALVLCELQEFSARQYNYARTLAYFPPPESDGWVATSLHAARVELAQREAALVSRLVRVGLGIEPADSGSKP